MYIRGEEPPLPRKPLEDVRPAIREGDAGSGHQLLDGVGHEDLAGLCAANAARNKAWWVASTSG